MLRKQKLITNIGSREHVRVEGWTLLGTMLGVTAHTVWTRRMEDGWEARVEAHTMAGVLVGAAESECLRSEKEWGPNPTRGKPRDDYALRSMAQTRATSKALRQPLGFVVALAGFDPTPAEEMPREERQTGGPKPPQRPKSWPAVERLVKATDGDSGWEEFSEYLAQATELLYGERSLKALTTEQRADMLEKTADAALEFCERAPGLGVFPPATTEDYRGAWAAALDGVELPGPQEAPAIAASGSVSVSSTAPQGDTPEEGQLPVEDGKEELSTLADEAITGPTERRTT